MSSTATCPNGHASCTADYCDECGARMEDPTPLVPGSFQPTEVLPALTTIVDRSATLEACPDCGSARAGIDRYCEGCRHDFLSAVTGLVDPQKDSTALWEAVIAADRDRFDRLEPGFEFPVDAPPRTLALDAAELRIGRSGRDEEPSPEIDLGGAGGDPAISRIHAVLIRGPDGSYAIADQGSTNGTTLNEDPTPLAVGTAVPLADGDRVHVGAWTTITLRRRST